jgi:AraC family transcriptional regulator
MELKITETPTNAPRDKMLRDEYTSRINRVIDYIEKNIDDQLSLDTLANVANFSRFHFHRIFRSMVGETLNCFIQRIRIEKAAAKLSAQRKKSITDIAFECGFSGSAAFSRAFKDFFGMTPAQWRSKKSGGFPDSKICITDSKISQFPGNIRKDFDFSLHYNYDEKRNLIWRIIMKNKNVNKQVEGKIEVKEMPAFHVAYVRHIGPYKGNPELFGSLFGKLMKWAGPRDLLRNPEMKFMSVYYDDPSITDEEKLRVDACMTVPEKTAVEGEIGKMTIPGGKFAVGRFEIHPDEYEAAWNSLMAGWLPESGYQCDDRLCYELYQNDPEQHPEHMHVVDICVPVKPL